MSLQHLVTTRLGELGLSYRQAAARSQGLVSHGTIGAVARGRHGRYFDDSTLAGIALAIDLPESVVRESAGMPATVEFALPAKASRLSPRGRQAILTMLNALLVAEDAAAQLASEREIGTTDDDDDPSTM